MAFDSTLSDGGARDAVRTILGPQPGSIVTAPHTCRCGNGYLPGDRIHTEAECDARIESRARYAFDFEAAKRRAGALCDAGLLSRRVYAKRGIVL